jgi:hypothetical protein
MEITKRPGHDWFVTYRWEDDEPEMMSIFGVMTIEEAIQEARFSLNAPQGEADWPRYEILAVKRI